MKESIVYMDADKLERWVLCYRGLKQYAPNEKNPLLDILTDNYGNQIKIVLTN